MCRKKGGQPLLQDLPLQLKCLPRELRDQNLYPTLHISLFHLWEPDIKDKDIQKQYIGEIRKSLGICRKRHRSWEHLKNLKFLPHDNPQDSGSLKHLFNKRETKLSMLQTPQIGSASEAFMGYSEERMCPNQQCKMPQFVKSKIHVLDISSSVKLGATCYQWWS